MSMHERDTSYGISNSHLATYKRDLSYQIGPHRGRNQEGVDPYNILTALGFNAVDS
jgi:hypothetical protein